MNGENQIGKRIADLRTLKKLPAADLALRTGLSDNQLEQIENGAQIPSLGTLIRISRALGTRLGTLLDDTNKLGPAVARSSERTPAASFSTNEEAGREHLHFFSLAHNKAGRHMEPFIIDIVQGSEHSLRKSSHEGEEFIFVMEGSVNVAYGNQSFELAKGDSIYLDSVVDHLVTATNGGAKILAVVYIPV